MTDEFLSEFKSLKTFLIVFGALFVLTFALNLIHPIFQVFIMIYLGILVAVFFSGLGYLIKRKINVSYRSAVTIAILTIFVLAVLGGWFMGREAVDDFSEMIKKLPKVEQRIKGELNKHEWGKSLLHLSSKTSKFWSMGGGVLKDLTGLFSETVGIAVTIAIVLIIGIYMSLNPNLYLRGAIKLFPIDKRDRAKDTLNSIGRALRLWLVARFITMVGVGLLTGIGYFIAGMPNTLSLAILAGLLSFVPFLGPIAAVVPAVLVAVFHNIMLLVPVGIVFVIVHMFEGYLATPLIQQRTVDIPPVISITAQVTIGMLLGIPGIIIAAPLMIMVIVVIQKVYIEDFLGDSVKVIGAKD